MHQKQRKDFWKRLSIRGKTFSMAFANAADISYFCRNSAKQMKGKIVVDLKPSEPSRAADVRQNGRTAACGERWCCRTPPAPAQGPEPQNPPSSPGQLLLQQRRQRRRAGRPQHHLADEMAIGHADEPDRRPRAGTTGADPGQQPGHRRRHRGSPPHSAAHRRQPGPVRQKIEHGDRRLAAADQIPANTSSTGHSNPTARSRPAAAPAATPRPWSPKSSRPACSRAPGTPGRRIGRPPQASATASPSTATAMLPRSPPSRTDCGGFNQRRETRRPSALHSLSHAAPAPASRGSCPTPSRRSSSSAPRYCR